jgi:hypothetical protein
MEEGKEIQEGMENNEREEIFSNAVRAGKRTYFFDVKSTRRNDFYLTITESKKRYHKDGRFFYEKHKVFLYKEDFEKFLDGLNESIEFIRNAKPVENMDDIHENQDTTQNYTDVEFEDLESVESNTGKRAEE